MKHFKVKAQITTIISIIGFSLVTTSVQAVIPTTDVVAAGQRTADTALNTVQTTASTLDVISQGIQLANSAVDMTNGGLELATQTGNIISTLLPDDGADKLSGFIPDGSASSDIHDAFNNNDLGALSAVYDQVVANEASTRGNSQISGKERLAVAMMLNKAQTQEIMNSLNLRRSNYNNLAGLLGNAVDVGQKSDLLNRLVVEQTMMKADMDRMQIAIEIGKQNQELARRQAMSESRTSMLQ